MRREASAALTRLDEMARSAMTRTVATVLPRCLLGEALHATSAAIVVTLILAGIAGVVAAPHDVIDVTLSFACLGFSILVWLNETCVIRGLVDLTPPADLDRTLQVLAEATVTAERHRRVGLLMTLPLWFGLAPCIGGPWSATLLVLLPCIFVLAFYARTVRPSDLRGPTTHP